jgi:hypothetical protein
LPQASNKFRSKFEKTIAANLNRLGASFSYETLKLEYTLPKKYTPDFILDNGIIIEAKGYWDGADRTKHLAVRKEHPTLDIRFVFQNAYNRINSRSKTTYAQWCDKHDYTWAHQRIPNEWLL